MPKLRVVESRIFDGIAGFERGLERLCKVGSNGFWIEDERLVTLDWRFR